MTLDWRFAVETLEPRTLLAAVSWTGAAGDNQWTTPGNWSTGQLPGPGDDVTINIAGKPTIFLFSSGGGVQSIHSLTLADPLQVRDGTLAIATTAQLSANLDLSGGAELSGGTYTGSPGSLTVGFYGTGGGTLSGVTLGIDATVYAGGEEGLVITNGLTLLSGETFTLSDAAVVTFDGTQTLGGTGSVIYGANCDFAVGNSANFGPAAVTIGPGIVIRASTKSYPGLSFEVSAYIGDSFGFSPFINNGLVESDQPNSSIIFFTDLINSSQGIITASAAGASVNIETSGSAGFTSAGTVQDSNGGLVDIYSVGTPPNASFTGGNVSIDGFVDVTQLTISAGNVTFNNPNQTASVSGLTISAGALAGASPIEISTSGLMAGGSIAGTGPLTIDQGALVSATGNVPISRPVFNNGEIDVNSGTLALDGGGSQDGTFNIASSGGLSIGGSAAQTLAAGSTVAGQGGVQFQGGESSTINGVYSVGATTVQDQAQVNFDANASIGNLTASGGTITIGTPPAPQAAPGTAAPAGTSTPVTLTILASSDLSGTASYIVEPGSVYAAGGAMVFDGGSPVVYIASDNSAPGVLALACQEVEVIGADVSPSIRSTGSGSKPGQIDVPKSGSMCDFLVNGTDALTVSAQLIDGSPGVGGTPDVLHMHGSGVLELMSPNFYTGGTILAGGTIQADSLFSLGSGPVTFAGGTLAPRTGAVNNALSVGAADTISLDVGSNPVQVSIGQLGVALDVTGSAGGSLTLAGSIALQNDLDIDNTVPLTIDGAITGTFGITKTDIGTVTFAGSSSNIYTGTTEVEGGTLLLDNTGGAIAVPGALSVVPFSTPGVATSATVRLLAGQQLASSSPLSFDSTNGLATLDLNGFNQSVQSLSVTGGNTAANGRAILGDGPTGAAAVATLTAGSLSIAAGQTLDLSGNSLQIQYASGNDPIAAIRQYLSSGYGGGSWNGPGIISSTAAASSQTLGYADSVDKVVAGMPANTVLIKYTYSGDANLDESVNFADLVALAQNYGGTGKSWDQGDFNYDGSVNFADLVALAQNYGKTLSSSAVAATSAAVTPGVQSGDGTSGAAIKSRRRLLRHSRHRQELKRDAKARSEDKKSED